MLLYFRNEPCLLAAQRGTARLKVVLFPRPSARLFCSFSISFWSVLRQKTPVFKVESFGVKNNDIVYSESLGASVFFHRKFIKLYSTVGERCLSTTTRPLQSNDSY